MDDPGLPYIELRLFYSQFKCLLLKAYPNGPARYGMNSPAIWIEVSWIAERC